MQKRVTGRRRGRLLAVAQGERRTMRKYWIVPVALLAAVVATATVLNDIRNVVGVFRLTDPTGDYGLYLHLGGLAANLAILFVAVCVLLPGSQTRFRYVFAVIAFIPSVLEAIAV